MFDILYLNKYVDVNSGDPSKTIINLKVNKFPLEW